ncbi:hypothetical protein E2C01_016753 [Portunus trituberculatus]|uniref:Uncharacterized protein n=1 Tax=Portunus trituberculatus TaxID=210409 RepID=A0A5B7DRM5_PORTR|nr:hypothetical protein [Portunus trituberculatus]
MVGSASDGFSLCKYKTVTVTVISAISPLCTHSLLRLSRGIKGESAIRGQVTKILLPHLSSSGLVILEVNAAKEVHPGLWFQRGHFPGDKNQLGPRHTLHGAGLHHGDVPVLLLLLVCPLAAGDVAALAPHHHSLPDDLNIKVEDRPRFFVLSG